MNENNHEWFLTDRFGKIYNFDKTKIILGRRDCDIQLKSNSVDYRHCILFINDKEKSLKIKDLETANGTFINETQIKPNNLKALNIGDKIRLAYDQITFTVQKKSVISDNIHENMAPITTNDSLSSHNLSQSPKRDTELPSVVTDPERYMMPVVCALTDSTIDISSPTEPAPQSSPINFTQENIQQQPIINNSDNISKKMENTQNTAISIPNIYPKPAESFTIDFANNVYNDSETSSLVGLSKFVPSKLRSSFEGREKLSKMKGQSSNSFNKIDSSSDIQRTGKIEKRTSSNKQFLSNTVTKNKVNSKSDESSIKSKSITVSKKFPEKTVKRKSDIAVLTKTLKSANNIKDQKPVIDKNKKPPIEIKEKKPINDIREKNNPKNVCSLKCIFPTLSKRNSKPYLFEKMLMGDESNIDFVSYDEVNVDKTEPILDNKITNNKIDNNPVSIIPELLNVVINNLDSNDAVSEAGTYIIENDANENTVGTEETLDRDDASTISSTHFNSQELESKSSAKWLAEFPTDDSSLEVDGKSKRNTNSAKFTGCSMPHIPFNAPIETEKIKSCREDENPKLNSNCLVNDTRTRNSRIPSYNTGDSNNNINTEEPKNWNTEDCDSNKKFGSTSKINFQSHQQIPISPYVMGNQSLLVAEDVYVSDIVTNSTVPINSYAKLSNLPQKSKDMDIFSTLNFSSIPPNTNCHPRPTYSVASLDTALLLQDTEALLNDMEKRVYSRREIKTTEEFSRLQSFSTSFPQSEKIPFVDDGEEKEEDTSLFNYSTDVEEGVRLATIKQQTSISNHSDSVNSEDKNRSYTVRSPITSGIIRRNNSCKTGVSESITTQNNVVGRKLNSTIRNQRSCSLIEERRSNHNNNNVEAFSDYRNKPKLSLLATNPSTTLNRRGSGGYSSTLNSPIAKFEPISVFNSSFPNQKSKDVIPYLSNMLSVHRQKFNRYEYGQHSLKYNSNSTTMLYNKYNNTSPPWNGDDLNNINHNSVNSNYDTDYYSYNTMPEPFEASMLFLKHEPNIIENMQQHQLNIDSNHDSDFQRREDIIEYTQPGNTSGRSSAFSPVNSLHQSNESVNTFQITNKSRSSLGINEQRLYNYDFLLVSCIHLYSARLCRYTEEIVHRLRREDSEYKGNSPIDSSTEQSDSFGQLKSANRELQETLNNMRSLEKQLQKIERSVFPPEKSGRNSTLGSCTEDFYLNQLERINKELEDFVPIDDEKLTINKNASTTKPSNRQDYNYLTTSESKQTCQITISKSQQSIDKSKSKSRTDTKLDQTKNSYSTSEICSPTKSKYSSLSKRFQHHKD